ncbi:MAG: hypothetical protein ACR2JY_00890 [Chloroflexota bacterium]
MINEPPVGDGQWVPVTRAAPLLGLSESTLRRRIRDGRYPTRQEPYQSVEVLIPSENVVDNHQVPSPATIDGHSRSGDINGSHDAGESPLDLIGRALDALRMIAETERERSATLEQRASQAEQAAAMWQERARNLESQVEQLLALPAHEEEPVAGRRWWRFWRRVD